jgi:hypothetical protein
MNKCNCVILMNNRLQTKISNAAWRILQKKAFGSLRPKISHSSVFLLQGETKRSNFGLSTLVFGNKEIASYVSTSIYSKELQPKYLGKASFQELESYIADVKPDVAFVCASNIFADFLLSNEFFVLPYINSSLDISPPWDAMLGNMQRRKRRSVRALVRRIEELGYSFEVTHDREKLLLFYHQMYVPNTLDRHGHSAEIVGFAEFERFFKEGGLLFAKLNGNFVSGAIFVQHGNELYIPALNTNQLDEGLKMETNFAARYFLILWAKKQGYKIMDFGSSKPFLKDGNFRYKKQWGMKIKPINERDSRILAVKMCNFEEGTRDFLVDNPFIFAEAEKLKSLSLCISDGEDLSEISHIPGLSGSVVLSPVQTHLETHFPRMRRLSLEYNSGDISLPLRFLMKIVSEKDYDVLNVDF